MINHIRHDEVQVWQVEIDLLDDRKFQSIVRHPIEEVQRAEKFQFEPSAKQFLNCRRMLRLLLSSYGVGHPDEIVFRNREYGKPYVEFDDAAKSIEFNISHSGNIGLFAFSHSPVGVDIEQVKEFSFLPLVSKVFSLDEREEFASVLPHDQLTYFLKIWTRKEAYVKAVGVGLRQSFGDILMVATPKYRQFLVGSKSTTNGGQWKVEDLPVSSSYVGAIAVQSLEKRVVFRTISSPTHLKKLLSQVQSYRRGC